MNLFPQYLQTTGWQILLLLLFVLFMRLAVQVLLNRIYKNYLLAHAEDQPRAKRRLNTVIEVLNNILISIAIVGVILLVVKNYVNITPLLAGAGVVGIAISFGAQSLVKDIITGIFFLTQDQFGMGDIVQVNNGLIGVIIELSIRTITIRDFSGNTTTFPNSVITQITNLSKEWSLFDMSFTVGINQPIAPIIEAMQEAGYRTETDESVIEFITEETKVLGIDAMNDGKMTIRVNIKTTPGKQFLVGRVYRYYFKKILEEKGITL